MAVTGHDLVAASESAPAGVDPSHDCAAGAVSEASRCTSGKQRYPTPERAAEALVHVRAKRRENPDGKEHEQRIYECPDCGGWHLSSKPERNLGETLMPLQPRGLTEPLGVYANRLERRISEQRDQLMSLHALGRGLAPNRTERKRIPALIRALGEMTERWTAEREHRIALVIRLEEERQSRKRWWRR